MRGLTVAEALAQRGVACVFAVSEAGAALVGRFSQRSFEIIRRQSLDDFFEAVNGGRFDALVLDDYAFAAPEERILSMNGRRLIVIDDLADRPHRAHMVIDSGYGRTPQDYEQLTPPYAIRLVGPTYAAIRRAFALARPAALMRPVLPAPQRVFVSFGLSDVDGIAGRAVALIRRTFPQIEIDVALASTAESFAGLIARAKADPALRLHPDAVNVPDLMAAADFAVGAGGASTWERCCLGLPTLAVIVADNQRAMISLMAAEGLLLAADLQDPRFETTFTDGLAALLAPELRSTLRDRTAGLCDGQGAERIADAILAL